ncbi:MAG: hypothetical protein SRB1_00438 [Desulfobacteraceae bacterium Eth-SRB1]|nr:MAG: hypothetical protein SRB1_00438 [Desulfobacteraceae bacterium Eth-SRB1]
MAQGVLPFKYEAEKKTTGMTALAGLPVYLDLAKVIGLSKSIEKHLKVRKGGQGWTDSQIVLSLVLLNLAGGDCVDDIKKLEADDGFCEVLKKAETHGLRRKVRRALLRRWRKGKTRAVLCDWSQQKRPRIQISGKAGSPEQAAGITGHRLSNRASFPNDGY